MQVIDTSNIKPNSNAYKNDMQNKKEREPIKPIVQNGVVRTKKSLGEKFKELFIKTDVKDVKSFIVKDVVIPTIGNAVLDVISMVFFGETYGRSYSSSKKSFTSYSSKYNGGSNYKYGNNNNYQSNEKVDYRNIILRDRRDAENVVNEIHRRIDLYDYATVAELLSLSVGDGASQYTDNNWGWNNHQGIGFRRVASGYLIEVPEAKYISA